MAWDGSSSSINWATRSPTGTPSISIIDIQPGSPSAIPNPWKGTTGLKYDPSNLFVNYHDTPEDIAKQTSYDPSANLINVLDKSGNLVQIPLSQTMSDTTYYDEQKLAYNPGNFVPTYEDTVYFSKLTGLGYQFPIYGTDSQWGGFCSFNKDFPEKIEEKCNKLDGDTCAATSCCVLIGGQKCVAGNQRGPYMKSHYNDTDILNRSKYFYGGRCYGNCVDDQSSFYNYNNEILTNNVPETNKLNLKPGVYGKDDYLTIWSPGQTIQPNLYPSPISNICAYQYPNCNYPCGLNKNGYCVYQGPSTNTTPAM